LALLRFEHLMHTVKNLKPHTSVLYSPKRCGIAAMKRHII
jgi:hypothetical protein